MFGSFRHHYIFNTSLVDSTVVMLNSARGKREDGKKKRWGNGEGKEIKKVNNEINDYYY